MSNIVIDYDSVLDLLRREFEILVRNNEEFSDLIFDIEDEQSMAKLSERDKNKIYILVKFGAANPYGQAALPLSLEVLGIDCEVEKTQKFLELFVNTYNREIVGNAQQFYLTPVVSQNMIPVYEGFKSLFIISSTIIILPDLVNFAGLIYTYGDNQSETIDIISYNDSSEASLNPQPYPNGHGRTKSYGSFQTFAFSITLYPNANKQLIKDLFAWKFDTTRSHQNDTFKLSVSFTNIATTFTEWEFKCRHVDFAYKIGEAPAITVTFTL